MCMTRMFTKKHLGPLTTGEDIIIRVTSTFKTSLDTQ